MHSPKLRWIGITVCALAAATAALRAEKHPVLPPTLSQYAPPLGASRWLTFGESPLERRIREVLRDLPYFSVFDYVAYRVDDGRVTLYGAVMHAPLREDAANAVRSIDGVSRVFNLIRFLPNSPQDNRVRQRVFGAVYSDPDTGPLRSPWRRSDPHPRRKRMGDPGGPGFHGRRPAESRGTGLGRSGRRTRNQPPADCGLNSGSQPRLPSARMSIFLPMRISFASYAK